MLVRLFVPFNPFVVLFRGGELLRLVSFMSQLCGAGDVGV